MAARTLWKAVIRLGRHRVPVRLFAAAKDHTIHFRLLHERDRSPVRQRMIDPNTEEEVARDQRRKGAEIQPGRFVLLSDEDLAELEPEPSREIEILRFVPRALLEHAWYDRPYLLGPDGEEDDYWALVEALEGSGQEGIARWVMRNKEYAGSLSAEEGHLSLVTLRFAEQVIQPEELETNAGRDGFAKNEVRMAEQLISMLESDFDPARYHDRFQGRVLKLIESKAKGWKVPAKKAPRKREPPSLSKALKASLAEAKQKPRPSQRK